MASSSSTLESMDNDNEIQNKERYDSMTTKELRILLTMRGYDCSQCLEKSELIQAACRLDATDYDEEARKLFQELNLQPSVNNNQKTHSLYSNLDPIWKHPGEGGGTVYVGNYVAASDRRTLQERNIVGIVNCQEATSKNYFEGDGSGLHYHRFVVSRLALYCHNRNVAPLAGGFQEAFDFIQEHIARGDSVLIHCLAGAHRAGTAGTAWIMYKTGKGVQDALVIAKKCRPIIAPFGTLIELLHRLESELTATK